MSEQLQTIESMIDTVPDFPKAGINFFDIAPLLLDPKVFKSANDQMIRQFDEDEIRETTKIAAFDARGFLFGALIAQAIDVSLVMIRKKGKLPGEIHTVSYDLEYNSDALEIQHGAFDEKDKVIVVDDVLATGGTALAGIELIRSTGAKIVGFCALIGLEDLDGKEKLEAAGVKTHNLIQKRDN